MSTLVLLRHGQSQWNVEPSRFTGWVDVDLTALGEAEAAKAGALLAGEGLAFDVMYTSLLTRAVRTGSLVLAEMGLAWIPVVRHWRLNERHYGGLQGLNKAETAATHGEEQVHLWRRSYTTPPPELDPASDMNPARDPRYDTVPRDQLPLTECLADVVERVLPFWHDVIAADLAAGRRVLVAAHGNSLRALIKHLESIGDDEIAGLEIPTGVPRLYELDPADVCRSTAAPRWLGDADEIAAKAAAVAAQGQAG
ncbi:MAG: 2,3-diphosphoglycerate-dependent phosphoglycerate mutase [Acidimicrobiales bacterium]